MKSVQVKRHCLARCSDSWRRLGRLCLPGDGVRDEDENDDDDDDDNDNDNDSNNNNDNNNNDNNNSIVGFRL